MAGLTLAQAETALALWIAADQAVAAGQSYSIKDRSLSRADAAEITRKIDYWDNKVKMLSRLARGRGRTRYVVTT